MEIKIRNLNPSVVKELDEKAKRMGLSRQAYVKDIIENYSILNEINNREMGYKDFLDRCTQIVMIAGEQLEKNTQILNQLMEE